MQVAQAGRLSNVRYDIRGPVLRRARQLEAAGHEIIKLNLGNPAPFGLDAPDDVLNDVVKHIQDAQGYSDARGIQPARQAVAQFFDRRGVSGITADDVFLGNGVSELHRHVTPGAARHRRRGPGAEPGLPAVDRRDQPLRRLRGALPVR